MIPADGINLQYIKDAFSRRFWCVSLTFFVISTGIVVYLIKAPRVYKSSTLILVQPQEIPTDYVQSTVSFDATSRLTTLREQVMSRPRLEAMIRKYDLYPAVRSNATMFDAVQTMRKHIFLEVNEPEETRNNSAPSSFRVSFEGGKPAQVRDVTKDIANLFIEDNMRLREEQAFGTSRFLERELERVRAELRKKEEAVRQFKEKFMGVLPEQMENNHRILTQLQQQLDSLNESLQQTENRKVVMQTQLSRIETIQPDATEEGRRTNQLSGEEAELSLDELRQRFEMLKSRYSDRHPDVIRMAATIAKREKEETAQAVEKTQISEAQQLVVAQREDLVTQLKFANKDIENLRREKVQIGKEIAKYKDRIEQGPKIEQLLVDLRRGYEEASGNYESLLEKKLQAELAENLERNQKGEQFRILEPAMLPEQPIKPEVKKILMLGFVLALFSGAALAYFREYQDPRFWASKEVSDLVGLPVLVSIPVVLTKAERRFNVFKRLGTWGALLSMASILGYALFVLLEMDPTIFAIRLG